jgi:hypothetical protein
VALGGEAVRVEIWSNDLFHHKPLKGFHLVLHHDVDDIDLRSNSLTSKWDDLEDQVGRGLVRVTRPGSAEDQGQVFRKALDEWRKTNPDEGAATRWIIQRRGPQQLKLSLQALPASAKKLRKDDRLSSLAGGAIHLFTVPLNMEVEEHGDYKGPDAVLFAQDEDAVASILEKEKQRPVTGKNLKNLISNLTTLFAVVTTQSELEDLKKIFLQRSRRSWVKLAPPRSSSWTRPGTRWRIPPTSRPNQKLKLVHPLEEGKEEAESARGRPRRGKKVQFSPLIIKKCKNTAKICQLLLTV